MLYICGLHLKTKDETVLSPYLESSSATGANPVVISVPHLPHLLNGVLMGYLTGEQVIMKIELMHVEHSENCLVTVSIL